MKPLFFALTMSLFLSGCSATWDGVKEDTTNALNWTKGKVNQGASYVKEKTQ